MHSFLPLIEWMIDRKVFNYAGFPKTGLSKIGFSCLGDVKGAVKKQSLFIYDATFAPRCSFWEKTQIFQKHVTLLKIATYNNWRGWWEPSYKFGQRLRRGMSLRTMYENRGVAGRVILYKTPTIWYNIYMYDAHYEAAATASVTPSLGCRG